MARNFYFTEKVRSEQLLYEDLVIEALKIYGSDVYYLPRTTVNEDVLFGEDPASSFDNAFKIEMYIDNIEGFDGEGDLFTKFGVEIRDEATFVVSRARWRKQVVRASDAEQGDRPTEGDLIYLPLTKSIFQINHVEHEQPFYQLANVPVFKMRCTLFEYSNEDMETGVGVIDEIDRDFAYQYKLELASPKAATISVTMDSGTVSSLSILQGGRYYTSLPTVVFSGGMDSNNVPTDSATATVTIDSATGILNGITLTNAGSGYDSNAIVTIVGGSSTDSSYAIGDSAFQTLANNVIMSGEIMHYAMDSDLDSSRYLYLGLAGADDGKWHTFTSGVYPNGTVVKTTGAASGLQVIGVTEPNNLSENEQNQAFSTFSTDFLDFSENNPFGDPENQ